ncbi:MAG: 50S ribosomal protein L32 [Elusimicrobiota bacterium]
MAVPKRRQSKSRTNKRRSSKKIKSTNYSFCPNCGAAKLPHRVCTECGTYKDRVIFGDKEQEK